MENKNCIDQIVEFNEGHELMNNARKSANLKTIQPLQLGQSIKVLAYLIHDSERSCPYYLNNQLKNYCNKRECIINFYFENKKKQIEGKI